MAKGRRIPAVALSAVIGLGLSACMGSVTDPTGEPESGPGWDIDAPAAIRVGVFVWGSRTAYDGTGYTSPIARS